MYESFNNGTNPYKIFPLCEISIGSNFFYYFTNVYMNAILANEIYKLVVNSNQRRRTNPPSSIKVITQVGTVYFFTTCLATWYLLHVPWSPLGFENMTYCIPKTGSPTQSFSSSSYKSNQEQQLDQQDQDHDQQQHSNQIFTEFTSTLMGVGIVIPPFIYVFYTGFTVWYKQLLPFRGRTRIISYYFFRIMLVFTCFYIPNIFIVVVLMNTISSDGNPNVYDNTRFWSYCINNTFIPLQCLITLRFAITKDDIRQAVHDQTSTIQTYFKNCYYGPFCCFGTTENNNLASRSSNEANSSKDDAEDSHGLEEEEEEPTTTTTSRVNNHHIALEESECMLKMFMMTL